MKAQTTILSKEQLVDYGQAAIHNANALLTEAKLLYDNKHYARAYFLAYTALEESAKTSRAMSTIIALITGHDVDWKHFHKERKNHMDKAVYAALTPLFRHPSPEEAVKQMREIGASMEVAVEARKNSLYIDLNESSVLTPLNIFNEHDAAITIRMAEINLSNLQHFIQPKAKEFYLSDKGATFLKALQEKIKPHAEALFEEMNRTNPK